MCFIVLTIHQAMPYGHFCFSNENTPAMKIIVKKLMTIFNDFFEETTNYRNSYQLSSSK